MGDDYFGDDYFEVIVNERNKRSFLHYLDLILFMIFAQKCDDALTIWRKIFGEKYSGKIEIMAFHKRNKSEASEYVEGDVSTYP